MNNNKPTKIKTSNRLPQEKEIGSKSIGFKGKIKVLNLYAGIGGNRKLWENVEVTAIEINPFIANIYKEFFPNDNIVIADAHEYLINNFEDFDFIWSSPPCPSHSDIRRCGVKRGQVDPIYPDMKLYEEIILLNNFFNGKFVIENVVSYYKPLIRPTQIDRHYFWSNYLLNKVKIEEEKKIIHITGNENFYGFDISKFKIDNKRTLLRNLVNPKLGLAIFNAAFHDKQKEVLAYVK